MSCCSHAPASASHSSQVTPSCPSIISAICTGGLSTANEERARQRVEDRQREEEDDAGKRADEDECRHAEVEREPGIEAAVDPVEGGLRHVLANQAPACRHPAPDELERDREDDEGAAVRER